MKSTNYEKYNNIFSYLYGSIKQNGFFNALFRISKFTKPYFIISRVIKYATAVIAFIETSATLVLALSIMLIIIPIMLLGLVVAIIINMFLFKKLNPQLEEYISKYDKIVFIDSRRGYNRKDNKYLISLINEFQMEGYGVFVVSHSLLHDRFTAARFEDTNVWTIKLVYYFVLKKKFLTPLEKDITYIY